MGLSVRENRQVWGRKTCAMGKAGITLGEQRFNSVLPHNEF